MHRKYLTSFALLLMTTVTAPVLCQARLITDIWPGRLSSLPGDFIRLHDHLYFSAVSPTSGEELFRIAPLDAYRVILEVAETDVADIHEGMSGEIRVASLLDDTLPYTIDRITPITEAEDGRNYFRVEAKLGDTSGRLRPGMEGVAKTEVGERLLIWIWTEDVLKWVRLKLWSLWP